MKRSELFFGAILLPLDFFSLLLAGAIAYRIRLSEAVQGVRPAVFQFDLPFFNYMQLVAIVGLAVVGVFALLGLYALNATRRPWDEFTGIMAGISIGFALVIVYMFLSAELFQSRFIILLASILAIIIVTLSRWAVRIIQHAMLERGYGVYRILLIGNGPYGERLSALFRTRPQLGYRVVASLPVFRLKALELLRKKHNVDAVILTDPTAPEEDTVALLDFCELYKLDFKYIPNLFETYASQVKFRQMASIPLMELERTSLDGWGRIAKRVMDIVGAVFGLVVLSPLFLVTAWFITRDSRGPVFFRQIRIGRNQKPFSIYKFRSMYTEMSTGEKFGGKKAAELEKKLREEQNEREDGPLFKMKDDPRITKVGRFIRRWRIDELPQLINVLRGEMSLIGPRPHLPQEIERYAKHHRRLFTIKPGMSGMAQVHGNAGLLFEEEAKLDIGYIENWTLWMDVILLLKTFRLLLTDRNAV